MRFILNSAFYTNNSWIITAIISISKTIVSWPLASWAGNTIDVFQWRRLEIVEVSGKLHQHRIAFPLYRTMNASAKLLSKGNKLWSKSIWQRITPIAQTYVASLTWKQFQCNANSTQRRNLNLYSKNIHSKLFFLWKI